jgi:pimeloyl-ACP methyl ester carboxylesterase
MAADLYTTSRGFRHHYVAEGAGPPLVLIPGLLMSIARWREIGYIDEFARDFRVLAVDPLGHGLSDKPHESRDYRIEDCAADVTAVLDHEGVDQAHFWGYSRGATIAVAVAAAAPERVRSLVIGGGALYLRPASRTPPPRRVEMAAALRAGDWNRFWTAMGIGDPETQTILEADQDRLAIAAAIEGASESSVFDHAFNPGVLRRPPLVYSGSHELSIAEDRADAESVGAEFHEIHGRGHSGAFQDISAVAPIVREYLARDSRSR